LKVRAVDPKQQATVNKWFEENEELILRTEREVWEGFETVDNFVSFWRAKTEEGPILFSLWPEQCRYSNAFNVEKLVWVPPYSPQDLKDRGLTDEQIKRYSAKVTLDEKQGEFFKVLTRGVWGTGFGYPRMYSIFEAASQSEHMESGEKAYAYTGRRVHYRHLIGFAPVNAEMAQRAENFLWDASRAKALQANFRGRVGQIESVDQFDHKIEVNWIDPAKYNAEKWSTVTSRMMHWGGAAARLPVAANFPAALHALKQEAMADRKWVALHLKEVFTKALGAPPIKLGWDMRCFNDPRLAWSMVKDLMQQGPLSLRRGLEEAGFNADEEEPVKRKEASPKMDDALLPKYDPNHGPMDKKMKENPGRPEGTKTGEGSDS
jgi:hypothetical protein